MPVTHERPIGAHAPTSGGLARAALPYIDATGAEVVQVYVSNSRGWALPPGNPDQDAAFRDGCAERHRLGPYDTREEAEHALTSVAEREKQITEEDRAWEGD